MHKLFWKAAFFLCGCSRTSVHSSVPTPKAGVQGGPDQTGQLGIATGPAAASQGRLHCRGVTSSEDNIKNLTSRGFLIGPFYLWWTPEPNMTSSHSHLTHGTVTL